MKYLHIAEWDKYQHYKDRNPQWIKLHCSLMTSTLWWEASDNQKALIVVIMMLAARHDNNIPYNPLFIKSTGYLSKTPDLQWLVTSGFCVASDKEERRDSPWPSRYIPDVIREEVLSRDGNKCVKCQSPENLEIDHIVPVSKGGKGDLDNLQTLCRRCNRRKRVSVAPCYAEQGDLRSLEESREETEIEQSPKKRGCRLPEEFVPGDDHYEIAKIEQVNCEGEFQKFRDYYLGLSGEKAVKLDWNATFRNWLRNAKKYGGHRATPERQISKAAERQQRNREVLLSTFADDVNPHVGQSHGDDGKGTDTSGKPALEGTVRKVSAAGHSGGI